MGKTDVSPKRYKSFVWAVIKGVLSPILPPWSIRGFYNYIEYLRRDRDDLALQAIEENVPLFFEQQGWQEYTEDVLEAVRKARRSLSTQAIPKTEQLSQSNK